MPPQKASKSAPKADASEKQKSKDRDWLTTGELAQARRQDLELLAVFRHRSPRELDAMLVGQPLDDLLIGVRPPLVFRLDDLFDDVLRPERGREEHRERDDLTAREEHELAGGRA